MPNAANAAASAPPAASDLPAWSNPPLSVVTGAPFGMWAFTQPLYLWHMLFVMPMKTAITALSLNGNLWWLIMPVTVLLCLGVFQLKRRLLARRARG